MTTLWTFGLSRFTPLKLTFTNKANDIYIPKPAQPYAYWTSTLLHKFIFCWGGWRETPEVQTKPIKKVAQDSRFCKACLLTIWLAGILIGNTRNCNCIIFHASKVKHPSTSNSPWEGGFNKSPLAAQKKSHVFSKWPFPFITYWVSTRVSKIDTWE